MAPGLSCAFCKMEDKDKMKQISSTPLRQERLRRGWSRSYVAEKIGVEVATVGRWERGESFPHPEHRQKLCILFEKTAEEIGLFTEMLEELDEQEFVSVSEPRQEPISSQQNSSDTGPASDSQIQTPLQESLPVQQDLPIKAENLPVQQDLPIKAESREEARRSPLPSWWRARKWRRKDSPKDQTGPFYLNRRTFFVGMGVLGLMVFGAGAWGTAVKNATSTPGPQRKGLKRLWQLLDQYTNNNWIDNLASSPDGNKIMAGTGKHGLIILDSQMQKVVKHYPTTKQWVNDVDWSKNNLLAAANADSTDGSVQVWRLPEQDPIFTLERAYPMRTVAWSPDGNYLACAGHSQAIEIWDPIAARQVNHYAYREGNTTGINRIKWSFDGRYIACANDNSAVHVWETATGKQVTVYAKHLDRVIDITWCPGKYLIASASADQTAQVWDALSGRTVTTYTGHKGAVHSINWSPNKQYLVSGSSDTTAQVWDALTGKHIDTYAGRNSEVLAVCWSNNGNFIVVGSQAQGIEVWQAPQ